MCHNNNNTGTIIGAAVIGAAVGAVAALLLAPQSGAETRKQIKQKADELQKKGTKLYKEYEGKARAEVRSIKGKANRLKRELSR